MSTISVKIRSILCSPLKAGQFELEDNKNDIAKIDIADLEELASNVELLKNHILTLREHQQEATRIKFDEFLKANPDLDINVVKALLGVTTGASTNVNSTKSRSTNPGKEYQVFLKTVDGNRNLPAITIKATNIALKKLPVRQFTREEVKESYENILKHNPKMEDFDTFMRAYSPDYVKDFPINAKYKTATFYISEDGGALSKQVKAYYDEYKKEHPEVTTSEFREIVLNNFKKVK